MGRRKNKLDENKANKVITFIEEYCSFTKGEWAGRRFRLLPWQRELITELFGRVKPDGARQYRMCYCEIPKKNGKTELGAAIALYMLIADGEVGAEVYGAAADREQAGLVYTAAAQMVRNDSRLSKRLRVLDSRKRIVDYQTSSFYQVLSAEVPTKHGINPSAIIFDELHAQPSRELWDVLTEGTDYARKQQLVFVMTTAGVWDPNSICWEVREHARQVQEGVIEDPSILPVIYAADKDRDNWEDEEVWKRVNPSLGQIFTIDRIRDDFRKVKQQPTRLNNFLRYRLNMWVTQYTRWLPMDKWDECAIPVPEESLLGRECYAGLDLSSTRDLTAFVLLFPPQKEGEYWYVIPELFVPQDTIWERVHNDRVPYDVWQKEGYIHATPGNVVDYEAVRNKIVECSQNYDLKAVAYDPWGATDLAQRLQDQDGIRMIACRQGYQTMSPATKELMRLVMQGQLAHGGHPVLRWCADNMVVKPDDNENIRPLKAKARERIDGVVALIMAIVAHSYVEQEGETGSVYDERGIITL